MKRKYFLHRINAPMAADHVVYRLWVGESVREQKLLARLMGWAFQTGATLISWSEDVDYYLLYEEDRVFSGHGLLDFGFIQADITAAEAIKHVENNDWDMFEKTLSQPKVFFSMIRLNDPSRIARAIREDRPDQDHFPDVRKSSVVLTEKSKNLSQGLGNQRFIISFV